jgi:hypothetical protein
MCANTADRAARLRNMHDHSPSGHIWHAKRLHGPDVDVDALTALNSVKGRQLAAPSVCGRRPPPSRRRWPAMPDHDETTGWAVRRGVVDERLAEMDRPIIRWRVNAR